MRRTLLGLVALLATLAIAPSASAVKYGAPDASNTYPWVGLVAAIDAEGEPMWRCTGSLIRDDLFLTAGHCVSEGKNAPLSSQPAKAYIWFTDGAEIINTDPQYLINLAYEDANGDASINVCAGTTNPTDAYKPVTGYPCAGYDAWGIPQAYPEWTGQLTIPQTYDVGVVHHLQWMPNATRPTTYGTLADVNTLDNLAYTRGKGNVEFTVVGYGLQSVRPVESGIKQRMVGTVSLVNLKSALAGGWNLHYSNNPGQGHGGSGGTCFGDSGGPVIYKGEIVAVNSFVLNANCQGAGFGYRVDTALVQNWLRTTFGYTA